MNIFDLNYSEIMEQQRKVTIYHVHFHDNDFNKGLEKKDYYFSSISAIYEVFTIKQIGIQASSLYNLKLDEKTNPTYENKKCIIRKDVLITKSQTKK